MANCRTYMRGLVISFNLLLLLFGILMIVVGFSSGYGNKHLILIQLDEYSSTQGLLVLRGFGPVTVVIAILGLSASAAQTRILLLVYSALVFVVFLALMIVSAPLIQVQTQIDRGMEELFLNVTPLYKAEAELQRPLEELQLTDSCCGLKSGSDWKDQIPPSCFCSPPDPSSPLDTHMSSSSPPLGNSTVLAPCVSVIRSRAPVVSHAPVTSRDTVTSRDHLTYRDSVTSATSVAEVWLHSKPCGPILKSHLTFLIRVSIGVISAFTTVLMAAMFLSLALALERFWSHWKTPVVETTVDDFNRVKYQPQPSLT